MRVAVGQISSESSHFVSFPCTLDLFRKTGYLYEGDDLFLLRGTDSEVAGMLAVLDEVPDAIIVPLIAARANSSGPLDTATWAYLRSGLLGALEDRLPVDGVLLSHHGSMAADGEDDPEGDIAARVRAIAGPDVPIIMTLDLHGTVTRRMVEHCTAILGYERYPHHDVARTGERAAHLLLRTLRGEVRPAMALAQIPMIATAFYASTEGDGPFARLMREAKEYEHHADVISTSLFFVGSYIDIPQMSSSALVVADNDLAVAVKGAYLLAERLWSRRREFDVPIVSVDEAVSLGRQIEGGPILLLDTADTTGGGAAGDSSDLIRDLLATGLTEPCLATVVDPEAAAACHAAGLGAQVTLQLGHQIDPVWGEPLGISGVVERLIDGRFQYQGGILGGTWATMGPSAVLSVGSIQVLVMTYPTYDWCDEQYRAAGLAPRTAKFVGVKNMMNFRHAYADIMKAAFVLDLPGPTGPDMRKLPFRRIKRPIYPMDDIEDPHIDIVTSRLSLKHGSG